MNSMNTINHVITFAPDGTARCLWTDAVPLQELGKLDVHRASMVEFNPSEQEWEVRVDGKTLFSHSSRAVCLAWEIQHFNR